MDLKQFSISVLTLLLAFSLQAPVALANMERGESATDKRPKTPKRVKRTHNNMRPEFERTVFRAGWEIGRRNFPEARTNLEKLSTWNLRKYERAALEYTYAFLHYEEGNYDMALTSYKSVLAHDGLTEDFARILTASISVLENKVADRDRWERIRTLRREALKNKTPEVEPSRPVIPIYPPRSIKQKVRGMVYLEFTVWGVGIKDVAIIYSFPPGHFEEATLQAAVESQYKLTTTDPNLIPIEGYESVRFFTLPRR